MGTVFIIIIAIVIVVTYVAFGVFILGAARVSARAEQRHYVQSILHNIETRGQFDFQERNW